LTCGRDAWRAIATATRDRAGPVGPGDVPDDRDCPRGGMGAVVARVAGLVRHQ